MVESKKLQILRLDYSNGNYQRAYELADDLIVSSTDDTELGIGWIYKGLSAGSMSDVKRERLMEAISFFQEARKHSLHHQDLVKGGKTLSKITLDHVVQLSRYYADVLQAAMRSQDGTVVHHRNENIGEYAGREIGQTIFDNLMSGERWRKGSVELGQHFQKYHSSAIVAMLNYVFELTSGDAEVAQNIAKVIESIINTSSLTPMSRRKFYAAIRPLGQNLQSLYPETKIYYLKPSDKLSCPNCGYEIVKAEQPEKGCAYVGFMSVITLGFYLVIYFMETVIGGNKEVVDSASKGQKLSCVTCNYEWIQE